MKFLSVIEKTGNKLPDPATLFVVGTIIVFILSTIISNLGWIVIDPKGNKIWCCFNIFMGKVNKIRLKDIKQ